MDCYVWWVGMIKGGSEVLVFREIYLIEVVIIVNFILELLLNKRIYIIVRVYNKVGGLKIVWIFK